MFCSACEKLDFIKDIFEYVRDHEDDVDVLFVENKIKSINISQYEKDKILTYFRDYLSTEDIDDFYANLVLMADPIYEKAD